MSMSNIDGIVLSDNGEDRQVENEELILNNHVDNSREDEEPREGDEDYAEAEGTRDING